MSRYPKPLIQEDKSRSQLSERFADLGWKLDSFQRDLGEDLQGRIYEKGHSTGLVFDIQIKSCTDISRFKRKRLNRFFYSFEVEDLLHWEVSSVPTMLLVWDINKRFGLWVIVSKVIADLDELIEGWRQQKTVRVTFTPVQDTTDDGLAILRGDLIAESSSSISRWFMKNFKLSFSKDRQNTQDIERFLNHRKTGEYLELDGNCLELNERDERLLGPLRNWDWKIAMGNGPSNEIHPIRLKIETLDGLCVEIPYIELRHIQRGEELIVLSNTYQGNATVEGKKGSPLRFTLSIDLNDKSGFNIQFDTVGSNPTATELALGIEFINAWAKGGQLTIEYLKLWQKQQEAFSAELITPVSTRFKKYIDILCFIEQNTSIVFHVPDWKLSESDYANLDLLNGLNTKGIAHFNDFPIQIPLTCSNLKDPQVLEDFLDFMEKEEHYIERNKCVENAAMIVLGKSVPTGPVTVCIRGKVNLSRNELREKILNNKSDYLLLDLSETKGMYRTNKLT